MPLMFLRSDEGLCSHIDFLLNTMCNWAAVDIRSRKSTQSSSINHGNNDAAKGETIFLDLFDIWLRHSWNRGQIFNEYPRVLSDSDVNDQHVAMFLTTCYNHDCFIINEHGSGATYWYGDEDFMSQWKQLARKVHKNTLEFRIFAKSSPSWSCCLRKKEVDLSVELPTRFNRIYRIVIGFLSNLNVLTFWGHWLL